MAKLHKIQSSISNSLIGDCDQEQALDYFNEEAKEFKMHVLTTITVKFNRKGAIKVDHFHFEG